VHPVFFFDLQADYNALTPIQDFLGGGGNDFLIGDVAYAQFRQLSPPVGDGDLLEGGEDDDYLEGGFGDDTMDGGNGDDSYVYERNYGSDTITDSDGVDRLGFRYDQAGFASFFLLGEDEQVGFDHSPTMLFLPVDLDVYRDGDDLVIVDLGSDDPTANQIVIEDFATTGTVESFVFGDLYADFELRPRGVLFGDTEPRVVFTLADPESPTAGNDFVVGFDVAETISADGGHDIVYGNGGADDISGGDGNDFLIGGAGDDTLSGGDGNDVLTGSEGNDILDGDAGEDTVSYLAARSGVSVHLINGTATDDFGTVDELIDIEQARASLFDDVIVGGFNNNIIQGFAGHDAIAGSVGDDEIYGNEGNDALFGGLGDDTLVGHSGNDYLNGGGDTDLLIGGSDIDVLYGGSGDDLLFAVSLFVQGGSSGDMLFGEDGDDFISGADAATVAGGDGDDVLEAGDGSTIDGGAGLDTLLARITAGEPGTPVSLELSGEVITLEFASPLNEQLSLAPHSPIIIEGSIVNLSDAQVTLEPTGDPDVVIAPHTSVEQLDRTVTVNDIERVMGSGDNDLLIGSGGSIPVMGFENGFAAAGWSTVGDASVVDDAVGVVPPEGDFQALLNSVDGSDGSALQAELETFAGVAAGTLDNLENAADAVDGAAIKKTVTVEAGDTLSFQWNFVTNDGFGELTFNDTTVVLNDFAFVLIVDADGNVINAGETILIDEKTGNLVQSSAEGFDFESGYQQFSFTFSEAGQFTVAIGVVDAGDAEFNSGLLVDDFSIALAIDNNALLGVIGDDLLYGLGGDDTLFGGAGEDQLFGGAGDDTLDGGAGDDILRGEVGDDFYMYGRDVDDSSSIDTEEQGLDTVIDSGGELDGIGFRSSEDDPLVPADISMTRVGDDLIIRDLALSSDLDPVGLDVIGQYTDDGRVELFRFESIPDTLFWFGAPDDSDAGQFLRDLLALVEPSPGIEVGDLIVAGDDADTIDGGAGRDLIYGNDGDDSLEGGADDDILIGDGGDDTLAGGEGADSLYGGDDADELLGGAGDDTLDGGAGNDVLDGGDDSLPGGGGTDTASFLSATASVTVDLANQDPQDTGDGTDRLLSIENVIGSRQGDTLTGSADANVLDGNLGDDTIDGGGGNDTLAGGDGMDELIGGEGDDLLLGGDGDDFLAGGAGADELDGGFDDDTLEGGADDDRYLFRRLPDDPDTGTRNSPIIENAGTDTVEDTSGDADTIVFGADDGSSLDAWELSFTRSGDDLIIRDLGGLGPTSGLDVLGQYTVAGRIELFEFESLSGTVFTFADPDSPTEFDDLIVAEDSGPGGADSIDGGLGRDIIYGNAGDDTLEGSGDGDFLLGGEGNDSLVGGEGDDFIQGGAGDDELLGGGDNDTASYVDATAGVIVDLGTGHATGDASVGSDTLSDVENVLGSHHVDTIVGSDVANLLEGKDGNDLLTGAGGNDTLDGGDGSDIVSYADSGAGVTVDLGQGTASGDGSVGDDTLIDIEGAVGSEHDDVLVGSGGDDVLVGGEGADTLTGGGGDDELTGGNGADVFVWNEVTEGVDLITDFDTALDTLNLSDLFSDQVVTAGSGHLNLFELDAVTIVQVDVDGGGDNFVDVAVLLGATGLDLGTMLDQGAIVVDS
jgi:Ca2+-binding RTX toxin-like protein